MKNTTKTTKADRKYAKYIKEQEILMPELIRFFNGDTKAAAIVAEEMAWGLIYA